MYYNDNLARKYEYTSDLHARKNKSDLTFGKSHAKTVAQRRMSFKFVAVIIFFLAGALIILSKNVRVTEQNDKVSQLKTQYNDIVSENKKSEIAINKKIDLKTVEEMAISNYNMNRAKKSQIVYIDVQAEDYGIINSQKEDNGKGIKNDDSEKKSADNSKLASGLVAYLK